MGFVRARTFVCVPEVLLNGLREDGREYRSEEEYNGRNINPAWLLHT